MRDQEIIDTSSIDVTDDSPEYVSVTTRIGAIAVRVNDELHDGDRTYLVTAVDPKVKWTTITTRVQACGEHRLGESEVKRRRFRLCSGDDGGDTVVVTRLEETAASRASRRVKRYLDMLMSAAANTYGEAVKPLVDRPLEYYDVDDRLSASARWKEVILPILRYTAQGEGRTLVDGLQYGLKQVEEKLLDDRWRGGSTSATSNAYEAAARAEASRFHRDYEHVIDYISDLNEMKETP